MTEVWTRWEGQVINGVFPLRRFVRASDHSAVFLTEYAAQSTPIAALKLVPAIPKLAQAQLSRWSLAAALAHPHLIRLFEAGSCQIGDLDFIFVVMEYAEQTLSQILPQRPLTADEVRETLPPILSALAFLHGRNLVQGQLKPSNVLVVDDQLKLASDTIRPAGESTATITEPSVYDPPEAYSGSASAAGDIWSLGITLTEALTQRAPSLPDSGLATALLSSAVPRTLVDIVRQCLNQNPVSRPTVMQLEAQISRAPQLPPASLPQAPVAVSQPSVSVTKLELIAEARIRAAPGSTTPPEESPIKRRMVPAIAVIFTLLVAVWVGSRLLSSRTSSEPAAPTGAAQNPEESLPNPPTAPPPANGAPFVLHEEIPEVSRHARETIRGHIKIAVRVTVDSSGNVVNEALETRSRSNYFARMATEAARKWKFAPAHQDSRKLLLQFEFTRDGVTGHAATLRS
ncbi:MAG: serine/threonine-protein kinase [Steroidobacteraceae bacterium]